MADMLYLKTLGGIENIRGFARYLYLHLIGSMYLCLVYLT